MCWTETGSVVVDQRDMRVRIELHAVYPFVYPMSRRSKGTFLTCGRLDFVSLGRYIHGRKIEEGAHAKDWARDEQRKSGP